jgi:hypothetical protein
MVPVANRAVINESVSARIATILRDGYLGTGERDMATSTRWAGEKLSPVLTQGYVAPPSSRRVTISVLDWTYKKWAILDSNQ